MDKSYKIQDGCHNCKHCFVMSEYDDANTYYCTLNAPPRPLCGSTAMREDFKWDTISSAKNKGKRYEDWEEWEAGRRVKREGICDKHQPKL